MNTPQRGMCAKVHIHTHTNIIVNVCSSLGATTRLGYDSYCIVKRVFSNIDWWKVIAGCASLFHATISQKYAICYDLFALFQFFINTFIAHFITLIYNPYSFNDLINNASWHLLLISNLYNNRYIYTTFCLVY